MCATSCVFVGVTFCIALFAAVTDEPVEWMQWVPTSADTRIVPGTFGKEARFFFGTEGGVQALYFPTSRSEPMLDWWAPFSNVSIQLAAAGRMLWVGAGSHLEGLLQKNGESVLEMDYHVPIASMASQGEWLAVGLANGSVHTWAGTKEGWTSASKAQWMAVDEELWMGGNETNAEVRVWTNGTQLWERNMDDIRGVCLGAEVVLVRERVVEGFDRRTGEVRWNASVAGGGGCVAKDETVAVFGWDGLSVLSGGIEQWTLDGALAGLPLVHGETMYVPFRTGVGAFHVQSGKEMRTLWLGAEEEVMTQLSWDPFHGGVVLGTPYAVLSLQMKGGSLSVFPQWMFAVSIIVTVLLCTLTCSMFCKKRKKYTPPSILLQTLVPEESVCAAYTLPYPPHIHPNDRQPINQIPTKMI